LLGILYPHFLAPIPSLSIVQMHADADAANASGGLQVERGTMLFSKPSGGVRCRFRTAYPVTLWPLEVASTELVTATAVAATLPEARSALRIRLKTTGGAKLGELGLASLRFFLDGAGSHRVELFLRPVGLVRSRQREAAARAGRGDPAPSGSAGAGLLAL
jgi:type VI secretion system protein ImpG